MTKRKQYELKPMDGKNGMIYVGIPRERVYIPAFVDNRDSILFHLQQKERGAGYFQAEGHRVDRNRDRITNQFLDLKDKPEWLGLLDSDMEHAPSCLERLTAWGKPIVGGLYFHRGDVHDPFVFNRAEKQQDKYGRMTKRWRPLRDEVYDFITHHGVPMNDGPVTIDDWSYSPLLECDAVATGVMVIHRSVLEFMPKPVWEYRAYGHSEDLIFCHEAKEAGVPVYADLSTISGHYNWVPMGQAQFRTLFEARGINLTNYSRQKAAEWLEEFYQIPIEKALKTIEDGNAHMVGDLWHERFPEGNPTDEEVATFYEDEAVGKAYVIELLHWNYTKTFYRLRSMLIPFRDKNVLEIGSGIGTVAIQLSLQRNNVVASEVNPLLRRFSQMRFKEIEKYSTARYGDIEWMGEEWRDSSREFDMVACFDTFEHLPKEPLIDLVTDIYNHMPIGGRLIYHANWSQQDLYPMHFDHSTWWSEFLYELGFFSLHNHDAVKVR